MSAGRRNRLITIQRPVVTVSNTGSTTQAWETFVSLWAEMKDRTSTGVENEHASTTLSIRRADWVIRQTVGITPAMRIIYDNTVWDILAINSLSYDRNKMLLVTEQRASLTAEDVATCPTLCERIDAADAQDIVDCLSAEQETAVKALICPSTEPATYTNGAAFTQEIAGGETYTAPQVTMTAVDGTTEDIPANEDYTCAWKAITGEASDGNKLIELNSYPLGGVFPINDNIYRDAGVDVIQRAYRETIHVINANIESVVNDTPNDGQANLTIEVDVPVVNSNGDSVGGNVDDLLNPHVLPDLPVTDSNGAVGSYPMPTALAVVGQVNSATYSGGTLTITPAGGASGGIAPIPVFATQVNLFGETGFVEGAQIAAGIFDPPTGPFSNCQGLDYSASSPFITLKHAHLGGTARWRDSSNNALAYGDATVADGLVTDLGFDRQWYIVRQSAANFQAALDAAAAATYGGHTNWRLPIRAELWTLFDLNNTNFINSIDGRPPGFDANSTNSVVSCTTAELASTLAYGTFGTNRRTQFFNKANSVFYILVRNFGSY